MKTDKSRKSTSETNDHHKMSVKTENSEETAPTGVGSQKAERINRNARLIVRNVSFKATEETLQQHFDPYGTILEVKLLKRPDGKLVGCAFVAFKNVPMAKKALLNTNMKPFLGRPISVDWAVAKNKYMQFVDQQKLQMLEDVKKEDSDSDAEHDTSALNATEDNLKQEVKSESDGVSDEKSEADDESDDENDDNDEDDEDMSDIQSEVSTQAERKRIMLNDAEDGCTVFITNIAFSVDNDRLKQFVETTAPVKYALVCVDKMTEHSRGTGFVKFSNEEDAQKFLSLPAEQLLLEGQRLQVKPALKRESLQSGNKKQPKDNRNLYLVKEGVIVAGTKAAVGVSTSDMAKRLTLERSKTQMLKNLNRFVSRYRLVVSNLPARITDASLRAMCVKAAPSRAAITEARVMRHLHTAPVGGMQPSKGYGFVMFMRHEDALACLRKLNNNPDIFDKNNRPIVSFSIEDRTALNARKKRLEKSIANNLQAKKEGPVTENNRKGRKRQIPDESKVNKGKKFAANRQDKSQSEVGKFVRIQRDDTGEFSGLTAGGGAGGGGGGGRHPTRSNHKLKMQANLHRENVKLEKKQSKHALKLKQAAKERVKQPKQKINKNKNKNKRNSVISEKSVKAAVDKGEKFTDIVSRYKSKLVGNSLERVKVKWYDN